MLASPEFKISSIYLWNLFTARIQQHLKWLICVSGYKWLSIYSYLISNFRKSASPLFKVYLERAAVESLLNSSPKPSEEAPRCIFRTQHGQITSAFFVRLDWCLSTTRIMIPPPNHSISKGWQISWSLCLKNLFFYFTPALTILQVHCIDSL